MNNNSFITIPENFNIDMDYYYYNPHMLYIYPYSVIVDMYSRKKASKIMWCITFLSYPDEQTNKMFRLSLKERLDAVKRMYNQFNEKDETVMLCIDEFPSKALNLVERNLLEEKDILDMRTKLLKEMYKEQAEEKNIKQIAALEKLLANTNALYTKYKKVEEEFFEAKNKKSIVYGGREESLAEQKKL